MLTTLRHPILTARAVRLIANQITENYRQIRDEEMNDSEHDVIEGTVQNKIIHSK